MPAPTPYNRQYNFEEYQALNPDTELPGVQVDIEFNAVKITTDQLISNLGLIQRSDGVLANQSVGFDQLKAELSVGAAPATLWVTATQYSVGRTVFQGTKLYRCIIAHTSGVFATDLAAVKWLFLVDFTPINQDDAIAIAALESSVANLQSDMDAAQVDIGALEAINIEARLAALEASDGEVWFESGGLFISHNLINHANVDDESGTIDIDALYPGLVPNNAKSVILTIETGYLGVPAGGDGVVELRVMASGYNLGSILDRAKVQVVMNDSVGLDVSAMDVRMPVRSGNHTFFYAGYSSNPAAADKLFLIDLWGYTT